MDHNKESGESEKYISDTPTLSFFLLIKLGEFKMGDVKALKDEEGSDLDPSLSRIQL